jgi:hypothetical protein
MQSDWACFSGTALPARGPGIPGRWSVLRPISKSQAIFCRETGEIAAPGDSSEVRAEAAVYRGHELVAHATRADAAVNHGRGLLFHATAAPPIAPTTAFP